jgi:DNA polymerase-3 subunit alpha
VQGKVQNDRFSGGLRLNVTAVWDLASARARFGRYLALAVNGPSGKSLPPLADLVKTWPAKRAIGDEGLERVLGLALRLQLERQGAGVSASAEIDLGDEGRFWPSDEALARCKALAQGGRAEIVYELT